MCTAIAWRREKRWFGRNLDLEGSFGEGVTVTPRGTAFGFGAVRYAMIGMAIEEAGIPLYFDAMNERGLAAAGLNFPGYAHYAPENREGCVNLASYEFIPWLLGTCGSIGEAREALRRCNLVARGASERLRPTPLHWMISDGAESLVAEQTEEGFSVYEDDAGVLTNSPPFPMQRDRLNDYLNCTAEDPQPRFAEGVLLRKYSRGMGAVGLPGDWSSASRFARAAFVRANSAVEGSEAAHFFRMLGAVAMPDGSVRLASGLREKTVYSCCCDLEEGIYYYATYEDPAVRGVRLGSPEGTGLRFLPLKREAFAVETL